jgi:hypothetical protein
METGSGNEAVTNANGSHPSAPCSASRSALLIMGASKKYRELMVPSSGATKNFFGAGMIDDRHRSTLGIHNCSHPGNKKRFLFAESEEKRIPPQFFKNAVDIQRL